MKTKADIKKNHPEIYNSWRGMRDRCRNFKRADAHCYADKGITVCDDWVDVRVFAAWAIEKGHMPGLTIERIDGNLGYSPDNCRWATRLEQARNLSKNRKITLGDMTMCLSEWAEKTGIPASSILARIDRLGWDIKDALTIAVGVIPTGPKRKIS